MENHRPVGKDLICQSVPADGVTGVFLTTMRHSGRRLFVGTVGGRVGIDASVRQTYLIITDWLKRPVGVVGER